MVFCGIGVGGLVDDLPRAPFSLATPLYVTFLFFCFLLMYLEQVISFSLKTEHFLILVAWAWSFPGLLSIPIFVENQTFLNFIYCSYCSFHYSYCSLLVVGTIIFIFLTPSLIYVPFRFRKIGTIGYCFPLFALDQSVSRGHCWL